MGEFDRENNRLHKSLIPIQMNKLNFEGQNIHASFDVHLKSKKVTIILFSLESSYYSKFPN